MSATSKRSKRKPSLQLTLFVEGSLVSHSAKQERERAQKILVLSGMKSLKLSEPLSQSTYFGKMFLTSPIWRTARHCKKYVLRWSVKVMRSNVLVFRLAASRPRTKETEFGYLPTPTRSSRSKMKKAIKRAMEGKQLMTRDGGDGMDRQFITLDALVYHFLRSKKCFLGGRVISKASELQKIKEDFLQELDTDQKHKISPFFLETMMGFPPGWTHIAIKEEEQ